MKEKIINHGNLHDTLNYKALIEAQANNVQHTLTSDKKVKVEKSKVKKLTKTYIRGRLNK